MKTIKFADGYTVQIEEKKLTIKLGGRTQSCDPLGLAEVKEGTERYKEIVRKGGKPSDYLTNGVVVVRRGNGVVEAIQEITKERSVAHGANLAQLRAQRQSREAEDALLLTRVSTEAAALRATIADDEIEVSVKVTDLDGYEFLTFYAGDIRLKDSDVRHVGSPSATREGAYAPFVTERIYVMKKSRLVELEAEVQAKTAALEAEKETKTAEIKAKYAAAASTGQPVFLYEITDMEPCEEEGCVDICRYYAMPDGSKKEERIHTY